MKQPPERRLSAILAADVAGYSRLMGADEEGTAQALREHRTAADPLVAQHGGRSSRPPATGCSSSDGVNIAARIEALADPGGVFVSNTVHDQVRDRLPFGGRINANLVTHRLRHDNQSGWRTCDLDLANEQVTLFRDEGAGDERQASAISHKGALTIAEAKAGLSAALGVPPDAIEITIRA